MKKTLIIIASLIILIVVVALTYLKVGLPNVGAAPVINLKTTHADVNRGRYLAMHVAVCMDCHSTRDWSKYSGPMVPGTVGKGGEYFGPEMGFPGKFYSRNLTPASLGDWTSGEIFRAITSGVDKVGNALFPVMPYLHFGRMARSDVLDIIAYLRTLKPIHTQIPEDQIDFPMNFIVNTIPQKPTFTTLPDRSDTVAYGAYLVNIASCIDCHTPVVKGKIIAGKEFSGGRTFKMPNGTLRSANITPDKETGIGLWTEAGFIAKFKIFENPAMAYALDSGQLNTLMPWTMYAGMDTCDLKAIYAYLCAQKPINNKVIHFTRESTITKIGTSN